MTWTSQIALTALVVTLFEMVLHWFPWRLALRKDLPRLWSYSLGVLGMVVPLSILLLLWIKEYEQAGYPIPGGQDAALIKALVALWAVVLAAGGGVALGYAVDWVVGKVTLAHELGELLELKQDAG